MSWLGAIAGVALCRLGAGLRPGASGAERAVSALGGVVAVIGHGLHLSLFHVMYAFIVSGALPLVGDPSRVDLGSLTWTIGAGFSLGSTLTEALRRYWPFLLITIVRDAPDMLTRNDDESAAWQGYKRMFRCHALVMLSVAVFLIGAESFVGFAFALLILFSPGSLWQALGRGLRAVQS